MIEQQDQIGQQFSAVKPPEKNQPVSEDASNQEALTLALASTKIGGNTEDYADRILAVAQGYKNLAQTTGTQEARRKIAFETQLKSLTEVKRLTQDASVSDELKTGAVSTIDALYQENLDEKAAYAAEEAAIKRLEELSVSDPIQAALMASRIQTPDAEAVWRDFGIRQLLLQNAFSKLNVKSEEQGFVLNALDFTVGLLTSLIPGVSGSQLTGIVETPEGGPGVLETLFTPKNRQGREINTLYNMSLPEFTKLVNSGELVERIVDSARTLGYDSASLEASLASDYLEGVTDAGRTWGNLGVAFETATAPGVATAMKLLKAGSLGTIAYMGGRAQAENITFKALLEGSKTAAKLGVKEPELQAAVSTTATNISNAIPPGVPFATTAPEAFVRAPKLVEEIKDIVRAPSLTDEERKSAIEYATKKFQSEIGGRKLLDVAVKTEALSGGGGSVSKLVVAVGKQDGSLYKTQQAAMAAAKAMGFPEADILTKQDLGGGWVVQVETGIPENGFFTKLEPPETSWLGRIFGSGGKNSDKRLAGMASVSRGVYTRIREDAWKPLEEKFFAIPKTGRKPFTEVLKLGTHEAKWYTDEEFLWHYRRASGADSVEVSKTKVSEIPPVPDGYVRMWHSGDGPSDIGGGGPRWFSTNQEYASNYRPDRAVYYVDVPRTNPIFDDVDDYNTVERGRTVNAELPESIAKHRKLFSTKEKAAQSLTSVKGEQEALKAYKAYIDANDIEWLYRNDLRYRELHDQGYETVSISTNKGTWNDVNAKINQDDIDVTTRLEEDRIYDIESGVHYNQKNPLSPETFQRMKKSGYVVVTLENTVMMGDGTYVRHFLAMPSSLKRRSLERIQIGYSPGGHRLYEAPFYVKLAIRKQQPDTGSSVLLSPKTFIGSDSKSGATRWAETMNEALSAAKKGATEDVIDTIFEKEGSLTFPSAKEFLDNWRNGQYGDGTEKFEVLLDRELPEAYTTSFIDPNAYRNFELSRNASASMAATYGKAFYGQKGEALVDHTGELLTVVDPFRAMEAGITNVARMSSFYEYKTNAIQRWYNTFVDKLERSDKQGVMEAFINGRVKNNVDATTRNQIEAQRETIKRVLRFKTSFDNIMERAQRSFANWAFDANHDQLGKKILDFDINKPINTLRSFVFDLKLGLFNPAQLPLQLSTAIAIWTLSPKHATKALTTYPLLRAFAYNKGDPQLLNYLIQKNYWKSAGFSSAEEFTAFMRYSIDSGQFNFSGDVAQHHQLLNNYGSTAVTDDFTRGVNSLREKGRFFFNEAEIVNQYVAYGTAWREVREQFPRLSFDSPEFKVKVSDRTQAYAFRMMQEDQSAFQTGLLALPTQFWAYPIRMIEAMGYSDFTTAQKARLILGQIFFWGSTAFPTGTFLYDQYKKRKGEPVKIGTPEAYVIRGVIDNLVYEATGADVQIGKRFATGNLIDQIILDFMGGGEFGPVSPVEFAGGAAVSVAGSIGNTLAYAWNWGVALHGNEDNLDFVSNTNVFERFLREISTVNNAMNAYYAYKYGTLISKNGVPIAGMNSAEAAFSIFGIPPGSADAMSAAMSYTKHKKESIDKAVKVVVSLEQEAFRDLSTYEENRAKAELFIALQPKEWQDEIRRKLKMERSPTMLEGLQERVEQDLQERQMYETSNESE